MGWRLWLEVSTDRTLQYDCTDGIDQDLTTRYRPRWDADLPEKVIRPRRRVPNRRDEANRCLNRLLDWTPEYLLKAGALCRVVQYRDGWKTKLNRLLLNRMNLSCDQKILGMIYVFPSQPFFDLKSRRYSSIKNCASCSEISPVVRADAIVFPQIRCSISFLFTFSSS